jgi:RNA polymerase sigma factor
MDIDTVNKRVELIQLQKDDINIFINEYKPFIASCVTKITGRFMRYGEDDELSIGMLAFSEAIKAFDSSKGHFLPFAQNVIRRRLVDYYRKEKKHDNVIYLNDQVQSDDKDEMDFSLELSVQQHFERQASENRRLEIDELGKELQAWGVTFNELVNISPKHKKTREICLDIIRKIISTEDIVETIKKKKYLPVAEVEKITKVSRKTIERSRKYIIAVVIIMTGDYLYLKEYIDIHV